MADAGVVTAPNAAPLVGHGAARPAAARAHRGSPCDHAS